MDELWSDWTEHDGSGCPVPEGVPTQVELRRRTNLEVRPAGRWWWPWGWGGTEHGDILRYRTRTYRAGLDLIASASERERTDG